ncbi:ABC transporter ATP-binding protein [Dactylosporangium sp. CA-233914]|uniref:ABC transporter ATP-binding protein n=1 Tax=Dactylosporangium sp. CA-233914 TaxID=3239934 RepID=UPI003D929E8E
MSEPICELLGVSKRYGGHPVVRDLNLTIQPGEMVAITGPSGSGKTTVLNMLGLLESPDHGAVRLFGAAAPRVRSKQANLLLRNRLAYLFQNFALIDNATVEENLQIAQTYVSGSASQKASQRRDVLRRVGLGAAAHMKPFALSGGEQQRVAIARILLKPCDLVLADEPTGSLDATNRDAVIDMLRNLSRSGKTIVIVTHDPVVAESCTRVIALRSTHNPVPA